MKPFDSLKTYRLTIAQIQMFWGKGEKDYHDRLRDKLEELDEFFSFSKQVLEDQHHLYLHKVLMHTYAQIDEEFKQYWIKMFKNPMNEHFKSIAEDMLAILEHNHDPMIELRALKAKAGSVFSKPKEIS